MARADEFDVIELIDADDSAFAPAGGRERPEKDRQAGAGDQWLLLPTAWVVIGLLLMGALAWVWQPWRERPEFTVGPVTSVETTLTERLVLDRPIFEGRMADVRVTLDVPTDGYVLADPTAAPWTTGGWADARAAIVAVAAEDPRYVNDSVSTDWSPIAAIQGAPAEYRDGGQSGIQVVFGPVGEQWYEVQSIGLGLDATVALAAVIRWTPHGLIVMDRARLLGLEPLYPFSSFWTAIGLVEAVDPRARFLCRCTSVVYPGRFTVSVSSAPAPDGGELEALDDLLGDTEAATVHGLRAVLARGTDGTILDGWDLVAWVEGGRMISVAVDRGHGADVLKLAESVRAATDEEWAELTAPTPPVELTPVPFETLPDPPTSSTAVVVADNGATISIEADGGGATLCVTTGAGRWTCTAAEFAGTASIVLVGEGVNTFAVALTNLAAGENPPLLQVTHPAGDAFGVQLAWVDDGSLPGPVAALAVDPGDHVQIVDATGGVLAELDV